MTSISTNEYKTAGKNLNILLHDEDYMDESGAFNKTEPQIIVISQTKEETISSLKKKIKHCKNHMERTKLEQELNALYKKKK